MIIAQLLPTLLHNLRSSLLFFHFLFKNSFLVSFYLCNNAFMPKNVPVYKCLYHTYTCVCIRMIVCVYVCVQVCVCVCIIRTLFFLGQHSMLGIIFGSMNSLHYHLLLDAQGVLLCPKQGFITVIILEFFSLFCIFSSFKVWGFWNTGFWRREIFLLYYLWLPPSHTVMSISPTS